MSSIIFGCIGKNSEKARKEFHVLGHEASKQGRYKLDVWVQNGCSVGIAHLDDRKRSAFFPQENVSVFVNGHVYGSDEMTYGPELEIIVNAYAKHGTRLARTIDGTFIAIIVDHNSDTVLLMNDAFGFQPCYYFRRNDLLFFASEAELFLRSGLMEPRLNHDALAELFTIGFVVGENTLLKDIYRFRNASIFVSDLNGSRLAQDDRPLRHNISGKNRNEWVDDVDHLLDRKIKQVLNYLGSERFTLGLSGGLDSRLLLSYLLRNKVDFTAVTDNDELSETSDDVYYSYLLARKFKFRYILEPQTPGWLSRYDNLLNPLELRTENKINGQGGEALKGKWGRKIGTRASGNRTNILHRLFTDDFISRLSRNPNDRFKEELASIDHPERANRLELFYIRNITCFFRMENPLAHRLTNSFFKRQHYPLFDRRCIEYIMDIPYSNVARCKLVISLFKRKHSRFFKVPCTTIPMLNRKKLAERNKKTNSYERQYINYLKYFRTFSPLWNMNIFRGKFKGKDEQMLACFFNIWHDYHFGHERAAQLMRRAENRWLVSK